MKAHKPETTRILPPAGTAYATCIHLYHIGTIETEWKGEKKMVDKIWIDFELNDEKAVFKEGDEAKPFVIGGMYSVAMGEKSNLRKLIEGITGKMSDDDAYAFEIESLLGKQCLLTVIYNTKGDNTYANIGTTAPLMKGMAPKESFNTPVKLMHEAWDDAVFQKLPQFLREKIESSVEFRTRNGGTDHAKTLNEIRGYEYPTDNDAATEDIPF